MPGATTIVALATPVLMASTIVSLTVPVLMMAPPAIGIAAIGLMVEIDEVPAAGAAGIRLGIIINPVWGGHAELY
jgi:hypothetical protein